MLGHGGSVGSVKQDYVQAHMWSNLAAAQGNKDAIETRDLLTATMTSSQVSQAQELTRNWKPTKP